MTNSPTYTITIGDGGPISITALDIECTAEPIRYDGSTSRPDQEWAFTDRSNHTHRWVHDGAEGWVLPTLNEVQVPCDGACGDPEHEWSEYHCAECNALVTPKWVYGRKTGYMSGIQSMTVSFMSEVDILRGRDQIDNMSFFRDGEPELSGTGYIDSRTVDYRSGHGRYSYKLYFTPTNREEW